MAPRATASPAEAEGGGQEGRSPLLRILAAVAVVAAVVVVAILWKGRIVESGPASELFNSDNQFVRQFLSGEAQGPLGME